MGGNEEVEARERERERKNRLNAAFKQRQLRLPLMKLHQQLVQRPRIFWPSSSVALLSLSRPEALENTQQARQPGGQERPIAGHGGGRCSRCRMVAYDEARSSLMVSRPRAKRRMGTFCLVLTVSLSLSGAKYQVQVLAWRNSVLALLIQKATQTGGRAGGGMATAAAAAATSGAGLARAIVETLVREKEREKSRQ